MSVPCVAFLFPMLDTARRADSLLLWSWVHCFAVWLLGCLLVCLLDCLTTSLRRYFACLFSILRSLEATLHRCFLASLLRCFAASMCHCQGCTCPILPYPDAAPVAALLLRWFASMMLRSFACLLPRCFFAATALRYFVTPQLCGSGVSLPLVR